MTLYDTCNVPVSCFKNFNQFYDWLTVQNKFRPNKDYSKYLIQYKESGSLVTTTVKRYLQTDIGLTA